MRSPTTPEQTLSLVKGAYGGDQKAFEQLFNSYYNVVFGYIYSRFKQNVPREEVEDIAMITLEEWFNQIKEGYDIDYTKPIHGFLCYRARQYAIKYSERITGRKADIETVGLVYFRTYSKIDGFEYDEKDDDAYYKMKFDLFSNMEFLRVIDATTLMMYLDGKSHSQMAKTLGVKPKAVNHRISRAKVRLHNLVNNIPYDKNKGQTQITYLKNRLKYKNTFKHFDYCELYYRENYRLKEIAHKHNVSPDSVRHYIRTDIKRFLSLLPKQAAA